MSTASLKNIPVWLFSAGTLFYLVASFLPDSPLWGLNHLAFISLTGRILLVITALGLFMMTPRVASAAERVFQKRWKILALIVPPAAFATFMTFRIATTIYGDTRTLIELLAEHTYSVADLLNFHETEPLTRLLHQSAAALFHLDQTLTFQIGSALSGGIFLAFLMIFAARADGPPSWKLLVLVAGATTGANQLFFGHVEDYSPAYLSMMSFLMLAWFALEGRDYSWAMAASILVGCRLHVEFLLMVPAFILLLRKEMLTVKNAAKLISATLVIGVFAYFTLFHANHYDVGDRNEIFRKIFLPLDNYQPEPHSYSLLSWKHLVDCTQEVFLTVSPASLCIFAAASLLPRLIDWKDPKILFYGIASFYFLLFDFTVNPLLSMERDWDFLSLAAAPLTFFSLAIARQLFVSPGGRRRMVAAGLALSVFSCLIFLINSNTEKLGRRLEGIGSWTYLSYYAGSSYIINVGEKMIRRVDDQVEARASKLKQLEAFRSRPDHELGVLYHKLGEAALSARNFTLADEGFVAALGEDSSNASALRSRGLIALLTRQYSRADSLLDYYNRNVNFPRVLDFSGLTLAQDVSNVEYLEGHSDSAGVRRKLDAVYGEFSPR